MTAEKKPKKASGLKIKRQTIKDLHVPTTTAKEVKGGGWTAACFSRNTNCTGNC